MSPLGRGMTAQMPESRNGFEVSYLKSRRWPDLQAPGMMNLSVDERGTNGVVAVVSLDLPQLRCSFSVSASRCNVGG